MRSVSSFFRTPSTSLHRHNPVGPATIGAAVAHAGHGHDIALDFKGVHSLFGTVAAFRILNGHFPAFHAVFSLGLDGAVGAEIQGVGAVRRNPFFCLSRQ